MPINQWYELGPFTVFDLETTGFSPVNDRIIEIAAIRIELDGSLTEWETLVNPQRPIPPKIEGITGINNEMVQNAPSFAQIGNKITDLANKSTLIAHNARFDLAFLQESLFRCGLMRWQGKTLDSLILAKQTFGNQPSYSLQALKDSLMLHGKYGKAHRAMADVKLTLKLVEKIFTTLLERNCQSQDLL